MHLLIKIACKKKLLLCITFIVGIGTFAISLLWNSQLSTLINSITGKQEIGADLIIKVLIIMLVMALAQGLQTYLEGCTAEYMNHNLRMWYSKRYIDKDIKSIEKINLGKQLSGLQNEINEISLYISSQLFSILGSLLKFIGTFTWFIILNPRLALISNLPVILIIIYIMFSSKIIEKLSVKCQVENEHMNGFTDTIISLFPLIKIYEAGKLVKEQYITAINTWEKTGRKEERVKAMLLSLSAIISTVPLLLLMLVGGMDVIHGTMEIGILYIFLNLSGNVSGVMMNMPGFVAAFRRFAGNMKRIQACNADSHKDID